MNNQPPIFGPPLTLTHGKLASQYTDVFEELLKAYKQISEVLPRVDKLQRTFGQDDGFRKALGLIYADIVGFHGRAYKFFRRRGS